jgi:RNA polymerase sigma-70 factor (ECF subfamily)
MALKERDAVSTKQNEFTRFMADNEPNLRRALVSGFGSQTGREAVAESFAYAWINWDRVSKMRNPAGYLYRVGESWARRHLSRTPTPIGVLDQVPTTDTLRFDFEPKLEPALGSLTPRQRAAVLLTQGWGLTFREASDLLRISRSSTQHHVNRGMRKLRNALGVEHHG